MRPWKEGALAIGEALIGKSAGSPWENGYYESFNAKLRADLADSRPGDCQIQANTPRLFSTCAPLRWIVSPSVSQACRRAQPHGDGCRRGAPCQARAVAGLEADQRRDQGRTMTSIRRRCHLDAAACDQIRAFGNPMRLSPSSSSDVTATSWSLCRRHVRFFWARSVAGCASRLASPLRRRSHSCSRIAHREPCHRLVPLWASFPGRRKS